MQVEEKILDSRQFRDIMGRFTTGITVVTVQESGILHGMTVNSFTSVSLKPLLVLVSLDKGAKTTEMLHRTGWFTVNILTVEQLDIARRFSENGNEGHRFLGIDYYLSDVGTPILQNTLAYVTCSVRDVIDGGDHTVFIGEVTDIERDNDNKKPLLYYRGNYTSIEDQAVNGRKGT
jgi:3-hydroxy-9,10-secoandrosta-1,3,5(10)-triene-9,17-dione monooxygenase reductase component